MGEICYYESFCSFLLSIAHCNAFSKHLLYRMRKHGQHFVMKSYLFSRLTFHSLVMFIQINIISLVRTYDDSFLITTLLIPNN